MNKGELIGKLQMVYVGDKNALNELIGYYDGLKQGIEELQQENQKYKEVIDNIEKIIIDNSYNELYEWFNELREERVIEIVNILDIKKDIEKKRGGINE